MTSWLKVPMKRTGEAVKVRPYFLSLDQEEFCSHFNTLFYSQLYAQTNNRELFIYDKSTVISPSYALLQETFAAVPEVTYISEMKPAATLLHAKEASRFAPLLSSRSVQDLRTKAREALTWNPVMLGKMLPVLEENYLPPDNNIDVGIHIRAPVKFDSVRAPAVQTYVEAVAGVATRLGKTDISVFVMVDEPAQFEEFKRLAPKTWVLFTIHPRNGLVRGGKIGTMGRHSVVVKLAAYVEYLTELYCMQKCSNIICNLSIDTGRFLYLTASATSFRSLDVPTWTPF